MENPLPGANNVFHDGISNSDQAAATAAKFFFISEDRLKVLALLARQVCQMCEEVYEVEIKSSGTAAHVHWSCPSGHSSDFCTQDTMNDVHVGDLKASAAVTSLASHLGLKLGDITTSCTIQGEHCSPVLKETHIEEEDNLLCDDVGSNNLIPTHQDMTESPSAVKIEADIPDEGSTWPMPQVKIEHNTDIDPGNSIDITNVVHTQPEMMNSPSTMATRNMSNEGPELQMVEVKREHGTDPSNNIDHAAHTQPEMMNSATTVTTYDISNEGPELQIVDVRTERDTSTGNYICSTITQTDLQPSNSKNVSGISTVVRTINQHGSHDNKESDLLITQQNSEFQEYRKTFLHKSDVCRHMEPEKKTHKCRECGKTFNHKTNLCRHMRTHTGEKPHVLPQCGSGFATDESFTTHTSGPHVGKQPHKCLECGKTFGYKSLLCRHMTKHTGEKPYRCNLQDCGKTFAQQSNLFRHMRLHTGEKPYRCQECGMAFAWGPSLKLHVKSHSSRTRYKCQECGKPFPRQSDLIKHMALHTGYNS